MKTSLDLNLALGLLLSTQLLLPLLHFSILVVTSFAQIVRALSSEPCSDAALDVERGVFSLLGPHAGREVMLVRPDHLILSGIHVEAGGLALAAKADIHLNAHLSHHDCRLGLVLISLDHALILLAVVL